MMKENKRTTILTTIVCLIPLIAGAILYSKMPEQVAIHWDGAGNPNGYANRFVAAFVLPGSLVLLNLLFPVLIKLDPKYKEMDGKMINLLHWLIPVILLFASGITLSAAVGIDVKIELYGPMFMGLIFIIIGNYMPKMTQSYTVGIKLPWTLADEENWEKTHRMAGFVWVIGGLLMLIGGFFRIGFAGSMIGLLLLVLLPILYSLVVYLKKNGKKNL